MLVTFNENQNEFRLWQRVDKDGNYSKLDKHAYSKLVMRGTLADIDRYVTSHNIIVRYSDTANEQIRKYDKPSHCNHVPELDYVLNIMRCAKCGKAVRIFV